MGSTRREQNLLPLINRTSDLVRPGDDAGAAADLLALLGTDELELSEIAQRVDLARSGVGYGAGLRILARWIEGLGDSAAGEVVATLKSRPIVQDSRGRWRYPRDVVIHRPDSPALPARLRA
jgi:hypothetical protein